MSYSANIFRLGTKYISTNYFSKPFANFFSFTSKIYRCATALTPYIYTPISYPLPSLFLPQYFTVVFILILLFIRFILYPSLYPSLNQFTLHIIPYFLYLSWYYFLLCHALFYLYLFNFYRLSIYFAAYKLFKKNIPLNCY